MTQTNAPDFGSRRSRRRFSWWIFGIGICLILGWNLCQPATWELLRDWTSPDRLPPEWMNRMEDISRTDRLLEGLTAEMLEEIKDDAPMIKASETRAAMKIWNQLNSMKLDEIQKASLGRVLFAQYLKQPGAYRGNVIRIRGTICLIKPGEISSVLRRNSDPQDPGFGYDFDHYYELWIQPDDNPAEPVLVNTLEIPESLPINEPIRVPTVIDGVFFKRYLYEGNEGEMFSAPAFYAKAPLWLRDVAPQKTVSKKPLPIPFIYVLGAALLLAGIILRIIEIRSRPAPPNEPLPDKIELP